MAKKSFKVEIKKEWCKGCSICVEYCPVKILFIGEDRKVNVSDESKCIGCLLCEYRCPDFVIAIKQVEASETVKEAI